MMLASPASKAQESAPAAPTETGDTAEQTTGGKAPKKIKDRRHPDYVRCRSQSVIGSLAKKRRVCMTNKEWVAHHQEGNRRAGEFIQEIQGGMKVE
ncbi:hypothetical protein [Parasphingorhabdus sp.]